MGYFGVGFFRFEDFCVIFFTDFRKLKRGKMDKFSVFLIKNIEVRVNGPLSLGNKTENKRVGQ